MNAIRTSITRYPLVAFFAIAYSLTWIGWIVPDRIYTGTLLSGMLALPFLLLVPGPLYAALIVTAATEGKPGVAELLRKFTIWRVGWGWFTVALLMAPIICMTPAYLNIYFGAPNPTVALIASLPTMLLMFAIRLVNLLDGPMQEELGWRGFALAAFAGTVCTIARQCHPRRAGCYLACATRFPGHASGLRPVCDLCFHHRIWLALQQRQRQCAHDS